MLRILTVVVLLSVTLVLSAGPAHAQASAPLSSPVSISVNGGLSAASRGNGGAMGAQLALNLTDRLAIEADGSHLGRGPGSGAMSWTASLLVNLLPAGGKTVPYLAMGGGLYQASFDLDQQRFFGAGMHGFYADRLGRMRAPANGRWGMHGFADPALSLGGGVRLDVSPRFYVRPDARALIVIANGASYTVGVVTVGVGYRF